MSLKHDPPSASQSVRASTHPTSTSDGSVADADGSRRPSPANALVASSSGIDASSSTITAALPERNDPAPKTDDNSNGRGADDIVDILRVTQPSGRVVYKLLYAGGRVTTATPQTVLDHVPFFMLQKYEHTSYDAGRNMETKYDARESMGGWRGGTRAEDVKSADARLLAGDLSLDRLRIAKKPRFVWDADSDMDEGRRRGKPVLKSPRRNDRFYAALDSGPGTSREASEPSDFAVTTATKSTMTTRVPVLASGRPRSIVSGVEVRVYRKKPPLSQQQQKSITDFYGKEPRGLIAVTSSPEEGRNPAEAARRQKTRALPMVVGKKRKFTALASSEQPLGLDPDETETDLPPEASSSNTAGQSRPATPPRDDPTTTSASSSMLHPLAAGPPHIRPRAPSSSISSSSTTSKHFSAETAEVLRRKRGHPKGSKARKTFPIATPRPRRTSSRTASTPIAASLSRTPSSAGRKPKKDKGKGKEKETAEPVEYEVEHILSHRDVPGSADREYLVKWVGFDHDEDTWEPLKHLAGSEELIDEYNMTIEPGGAGIDRSLEEHGGEGASVGELGEVGAG